MALQDAAPTHIAQPTRLPASRCWLPPNRWWLPTSSMWLAGLLGLSACQTPPPAPPPPPTSPEVVGEFRAGSGYLLGYLDRKALPNSLALLPKPPAGASAALAADLAAWRDSRALQGTPRWAQAAADTQLKFPKAAETFSCALDLPIFQVATPHLNMLLRRSLLDTGLATYAAKDIYQRTRPFMLQKEATCAPAEKAALVKEGSYPSGHVAIGWGWVLLLAELAPDRADALLQRGHAFGQSRAVCNFHWQTDVDAGRTMGAAAVARLHANPVFVAQAALARAEIDQARAQGARSPLNCTAQAQALAR